MIRREESFGTIPLTQEGGIWRVFLIQHQKGKHWGFPKGHKEGDEDAKAAAIRELLEETALGVMRFLSPEPLIEEYRFRREGLPVVKRVEYYIVEATGTYDLEPEEVQDGRWFTLKEAALQVTFPEAKQILQKVENFLASLNA